MHPEGPGGIARRTPLLTNVVRLAPVRARPVGAVALFALLAGCEGRQSVLSPAGLEAEFVASLFWWLLGGAILLWVLVNGLFVYVTRLNPKPLSRRLAEALIIGGGIVFPVTLLAVLLSLTLPRIPEHRAPADGLRVHVQGEQWWWRVEYWPEGATEPVISANEIRLPVGMPTEITLSARNVIHSFWVPALAGKLDMFPGRETRLAVEPSETGVFRGQCAEFCGTSHALMAFEAVVMEPDAFEAWLATEAGDARPPGGETATRGEAVFLAEGCGGCHTIRGTPANADVGPDLTHVGGRESLAAGILPMSEDALADWIAHTSDTKPGVMMPDYDYLPEDDLRALATYLAGLK
ncbi:cytochrome c oxidase subunit II [Amaricoccus macauensis]|uniref:cytochrome c oxidase subunit II n=1 Tax=Amaricoccus macauensis TaxID=57001 RepID=UPI003C7B01EC